MTTAVGFALAFRVFVTALSVIDKRVRELICCVGLKFTQFRNRAFRWEKTFGAPAVHVFGVRNPKPSVKYGE